MVVSRCCFFVAIGNNSSGDGSTVVTEINNEASEPNRHQEFWESLQLNKIPKVPCSKQKMDEYLSQVT